uniref:helix-turn-helix domain-containing protein n=1 Tax=Octadecabacter antarcticus TaxID=1217908 RepID=UPI0038CD10DB
MSTSLSIYALLARTVWHSPTRFRQVPLGADPDGTRRDITGSDRGLIGPLSLRSIARTLWRSISTISREVRLNVGSAQNREPSLILLREIHCPPLGQWTGSCEAMPEL